jgi:hypothetical protein
LQTPKISEYLSALEQALHNAGYEADEAASLVQLAVKQLEYYGKTVTDLVPRVPDKIHNLP